MLKECEYCDDAMEHHGDVWECPNCVVCDFDESVNSDSSERCSQCDGTNFSPLTVWA